ncbi:MAG: type II toxin-antitoxin system RatA family toxin [Rhodospirillales bacterium]|jgi:coenzyme Q-binding protein COQ10
MPTHAEKRVLPYTPQQLFELVSDVEKYPEFLPWCVGLRVRQKQDDLVIADMIIGYKMFRERFTSKVEILHPDRINVSYTEGPFKYLNNHWIFEPHGEGCCELDFYVDFEFRSSLLQHAINMVFNKAVQKMVGAFEGRAKELYG